MLRNASNRRAFVAGATGLTGRSVVGELRARHIPTLAHVRPDSGSLSVWRQRFTAQGARVDTTPWALDAMTETFAREQPSLIFALLGTTKARIKRDGADYMAVDFGLTAMLIDAAVAAEIEPRFVYLSAVGVGPKSVGAYYKARHLVELYLRQSELPAVIARPSFIVGQREQARRLERLGANAADTALGLLSKLGARRLAARYQSIQGPKLAKGLVRAALEATERMVVVGADELRR